MRQCLRHSVCQRKPKLQLRASSKGNRPGPQDLEAAPILQPENPGRRGRIQSKGEGQCRNILQEVRHSGTRGRHLVLLDVLGEDLKVVVSLVVEGHDRGDVPAAVAVVGRRPYGDDGVARKHELVAFLDELVSSADELEFVDSVELLHDLGPEEPARATRADRPSIDILGIAPHEVAKGALGGNLLSPIDCPNLIQSADIRAEAAVDAKNHAVDERRDREVVKDLAAVLPRVGRPVFSLAFVVEPVHLGDLPRLVVPPQKGDVRGVARLEAEEEGEGFERVVAAIHKVAHEDVIRGGHFAAGLDEVEEVVELPVDVTAHRHGGFHGLDVGLLDEKLLDIIAQLLKVPLDQVLALLHLLNPRVEIH
mmetsp:Transcript_2097/g.5610  ORF Transcript_2097/g.5610 Transcript_2097/m.5610 type:complete len:365 (+) Transcript_2097:114-1208(+)